MVLSFALWMEELTSLATQMLGGILGLAVAGAIFDDKLHANLLRRELGLL